MIAVRAMIFLAAREVKSDVGTLLIALDSGLVQVWTHHPSAEFLGAFSVIHTSGDCATSLATDLENKFLVTGSLRQNFLEINLGHFLQNTPAISV